jgi:hypothetical protein
MEQQNTSARPTFLTVLCILTFIASAWGIYSGITSYLTADTVAGVAQEAMDKAADGIQSSGEGSAAAEKLLDSVTSAMNPDNMRNMAIGSILSAIICALGAWFMWNLQKKGFWVYVAGTVVGILTPVIVYGGFMGALAGGGAAFIGILFVVLYGINLKHLS